ncbi:MAG TPA: crossover junction endodeoxyribonuclease RuvC [Candidatus Latescibacteria bacterium]|nr:crossover junction endodeoxyribonuclease RuvC [Candidatus Latescibacterota bacterium]
MTILGVDPGSRITGYGLIVWEDGRAQALDFGCIRAREKASLCERLSEIYRAFREVLERSRPDYAAVEDIFYQENVRSAFQIGHARGVILLALAQAGLRVEEYAPAEVKRSVVGSGSASKGQVQFMVQHLLGLSEPPEPYDASDALAVALCLAHRIGAGR